MMMVVNRFIIALLASIALGSGPGQYFLLQQTHNPAVYSVPSGMEGGIPYYEPMTFPMATSSPSYDPLQGHLQTVYIPSHSMFSTQPGVPQYLQSQAYAPPFEPMETSEDEGIEVGEDEHALQASLGGSLLVKAGLTFVGVGILIVVIILIVLLPGRHHGY